MTMYKPETHECSAYIDSLDIARASATLPSASYRNAKLAVIDTALAAIRDGVPRHRLVRHVRMRTMKRVGLSPLQWISLLVNIARIVQMVWQWWQRKESDERR